MIPWENVANKKGINFEPPRPPGLNFQLFLNSTDGVVPWSCPGATLVTTRSKSILRPGTHNPELCSILPRCPKIMGFGLLYKWLGAIS